MVPLWRAVADQRRWTGGHRRPRTAALARRRTTAAGRFDPGALGAAAGGVGDCRAVRVPCARRGPGTSPLRDRGCGGPARIRATCGRIKVSMIDCIAGYHLNPWTCGIAKFNDILARNLEVPVVGIGSPELESFGRPLLSLKMSEFSSTDAQALAEWVQAHAGRF